MALRLPPPFHEVELPRIYTRKKDALTSKLTVPLSEDLLRRLRAHAEKLAQTPTAAARDMIEKALPEASK